MTITMVVAWFIEVAKKLVTTIMRIFSSALLQEVLPLAAHADSVCRVFRTAAAHTGGPRSPEAEKLKPSSSEESSSSCGVKLGELRR